MKIVISGATGFIGRKLVGRLANSGHTCTALVRDVSKAKPLLPDAKQILKFQPGKPGDWQPAVEGADAVINLSGASVAGKRWTLEYKKELWNSRIDTTRALVEAMPVDGKAVLVNMSAIGYYGECGDEIVTEEHAPGNDFLAKLSVAWEATAKEYSGRVVLPRTGIVLGDGGALDRMIPPFKFFVGGPIGNGRQWFSWIHQDDVCSLLQWAAENPHVSGPVNASAPNPVTMKEFARTVGRVLHRPSLLPVPGFVLKLMVGEFAESLLKSTRVVPVGTQRLGFEFKYPELEVALQNAVS